MHCRAIVLDLDLTLLCTQNDPKKVIRTNVMNNPEIRRRMYNFIITDDEGPVHIMGIIRPHTPEFLEFCFKYFTYVIVWSAGHRQYVEKLVDILFKDLPNPHKVYTFDDIDSHHRKPLSYIDLDLTKTLHLDDNENTFSLNIGNGMKCPEYEPDCNMKSFRSDDTTLLDFIDFLNSKDIRTSKNLAHTPEFF